MRRERREGPDHLSKCKVRPALPPAQARVGRAHLVKVRLWAARPVRVRLGRGPLPERALLGRERALVVIRVAHDARARRGDPAREREQRIGLVAYRRGRILGHLALRRRALVEGEVVEYGQAAGRGLERGRGRQAGRRRRARREGRERGRARGCAGREAVGQGRERGRRRVGRRRAVRVRVAPGDRVSPERGGGGVHGRRAERSAERVLELGCWC